MRTKNYWSIFTVIILISLHLKVATIGDFEISLALLLIPFWVYKSYHIKTFKFRRQECHLIWIMFCLPFLSGTITDWNEFFKTFIQFILSYFLVIRVLYKQFRLGREDFLNMVQFFQVFLLLVVITQFVIVGFLGQTAFYNLFGEFQLYYKLIPSSSNLRMKAFYLEPSYLGFVIVNLFWIRLQLESKIFFKGNFILTVVLLIFTQSAFAYLAVGLIFLFELNITKSRYQVLRRLFIPIGGLLAFFFFLDKLLHILRLNEIFAENDEITSGYMRITYPFKAVNKLLFHDGQLFGMPFGHLEAYLKLINTENYFESSLNNAFISLVGYWGLTAILFYGFLLLAFLRTSNPLYKSFILLLLINLNNSGAFVPIQFVFVAFLLPIGAIKTMESFQSKLIT